MPIRIVYKNRKWKINQIFFVSANSTKCLENFLLSSNKMVLGFHPLWIEWIESKQMEKRANGSLWTAMTEKLSMMVLKIDKEEKIQTVKFSHVSKVGYVFFFLGTECRSKNRTMKWILLNFPLQCCRVLHERIKSSGNFLEVLIEKMSTRLTSHTCNSMRNSFWEFYRVWVFFGGGSRFKLKLFICIFALTAFEKKSSISNSRYHKSDLFKSMLRILMMFVFQFNAYSYLQQTYLEGKSFHSRLNYFYLAVIIILYMHSCKCH